MNCLTGAAAGQFSNPRRRSPQGELFQVVPPPEDPRQARRNAEAGILEALRKRRVEAQRIANREARS